MVVERGSLKCAPMKDSSYLVRYNSLQAAGWIATAVLLALRGSVDSRTLVLVQVLQGLALAEILHVVLGLSSGSVMATVSQVGVRFLQCFVSVPLLLAWPVEQPDLARLSVFVLFAAWNAGM